MSNQAILHTLTILEQQAAEMKAQITAIKAQIAGQTLQPTIDPTALKILLKRKKNLKK